MLTPDHIQTRRQKGQLFLVGLGERAARAGGLARELIAAAEATVGQSRQELSAAFDAIPVEPRDRKLKDALVKLIEDRLAFDVETSVDPIELRRLVFTRAAQARRDGTFDRDAILSQVGAEVGLDGAAADQLLFADLKSAHVVRPKVAGPIVAGGADALVAGYDLAQRQAVLLRATEVAVELKGVDRAALRALFRKLKFLRLLFTATMLPGDAVQLRIDGPFSLFESVTKYGLSLALALPWIEATGEHRLVADVRWGKERLPLRFVSEGPRRASMGAPPPMPDELATLLRRFDGDGAFRAAEANVVLEAKGMGAIVPDLVLTHASGVRIYLELLGYWSRDAAFARIEMVERGFLKERIVFCASERLRVSEAALESEHAALLTYKGTISTSALTAKLEAML